MRNNLFFSPPDNFKLFFLFTFLLSVCYSNSFTASWQLDDKPNILNNTRIQISSISAEQILQASYAKPGSGDLYRPIACITLALNWYFGHDNVLGYHVVNFIIHCSTAWFLFLTVKVLFSTPLLQSRYPPGQIIFISLLAALLWALNPVQTQAVTYIVQRMASLAAMFSIISIFCYLKARLNANSTKRSLLLSCSALTFLFALLSKENATTIILTIPVFELVFFQITLSRQILKKIAGYLCVALLISILAGLALRPELFDFILNYYTNRPFTLTERLLTEQRIVLYYLSQLFFPSPERLSIEHDIILSTSIFSPWTTLGSVITNFTLVYLAIKLARKHPFFSLAILFYYINHLVESTIVPLELIFEHRNYLPSFFLFLPVSLFLHNVLRKRQHCKYSSILIIILVTCIITTEGYATYLRNKVWQTEETLWLDAIKKAPNSARPLATLALKLAWGPLQNESRYRKALELTKQTLSMQMSRRRLDAAQLGNIASIHNKLDEYNLAISYYKKALDLAPEDASIRYNLCKTLIAIGEFSKAETVILNLLENGFIHADYFNLLGFIYLWTDHPKFALSALRESMHYAPGRPDILLSLGKCFSLLGQYNKANWYLALARQKGGNDAIVSLSIIENNLRADNIEQARQELQRSLKTFTLVSLLQPLFSQPTNHHKTIPLDVELLRPFIEKELPIMTNLLLP